jgi:hypothetical protein
MPLQTLASSNIQGRSIRFSATMAYNNKTVKQLKDICEDRRLSLKGVKANLIDRLGRNDNDEVEEGKECSICDEVRATEFFGPPPHDHIDKSAMAAQEQVCGFCWEDHILSRLSDAVPCEDITCMFCEAPLTQAEVRQLLGNKNRGYQV